MHGLRAVLYWTHSDGNAKSFAARFGLEILVK